MTTVRPTKQGIIFNMVPLNWEKKSPKLAATFELKSPPQIIINHIWKLLSLMDRESQLIETQNLRGLGSVNDQDRGSSINNIEPEDQVQEFNESNNANVCKEQSDRELLMLILKEKKQQQEKIDREAQAFQARRSQNKKSQIQKIGDKSQNLVAQQQKQKQNKIMKAIQSSVKKYTLLHRISKDTEVERLRSQATLSVFTSLMYGAREAVEMGNPTPQDQQIKELSAYSKCKQIVSELDSALLKVVNRGNRASVGKQFKVRWKNIMSNLQDPENYELRKKVLLGIYSPLSLCSIDEMQLYTEKKRQKVKQKRNRILEESIKIEKAPSNFEEQEEGAMHEEKKIAYAMEQQKGHYSHLNDDTLQEIQLFVSDEFLKKSKKFLEQALQSQQESKKKIVRHFTSIFPVVGE